MYPRHIEQSLRAAPAGTPVVLLNGARQTGKSTLARMMAESLFFSYATLDDVTMLAAAGADPRGVSPDSASGPSSTKYRKHRALPVSALREWQDGEMKQPITI